VLHYDVKSKVFMVRILWQRLLGKKVVFITGTDEHGEKIATAAAARGSDPSEHCDVISEAYKTLWKDVSLIQDRN
jgi:methionyl-tRNA synthetase